uniref:Leucine-rich repeat-containing N-terminal plant-type domain-containing protein n=1 Tax=Opuntia streptacantha TaxID=393608 RepID=A0A7C9AKS0_OPUST
MSWGWRIYVLWVLLAGLIQAFKVESCIEEERLALLDLNSYFRSHGHLDPWLDGLWEREKDEYNCCTWERVHCNSMTQHVIELDLSAPVNSNTRPWVFNVTMLQPFGQLMSLDLSWNSIGGLVEKDGTLCV